MLEKAIKLFKKIVIILAMFTKVTNFYFIC